LLAGFPLIKFGKLNTLVLGKRMRGKDGANIS